MRNADSLSALSRVLHHSGLIPTRFSRLVYSAPSARMLLFSFPTALHRRRNTNRCINLALPCRAIVAVLVYLFHSIVFSFLVTRPDVFPPSLSPHPRNLYFCYYWKSFLPGALSMKIYFRARFGALSLSLSLSPPPPFTFSLFRFSIPFSFSLSSSIFFSVSHSRHRFPCSLNFCITILCVIVVLILRLIHVA